jgi:hypothetical protein
MPKKRFRVTFRNRRLTPGLRKSRKAFPMAVDRSLISAAMKVVSVAKRLVPVDSGQLKGSIGLDPVKRSGRVIAVKVGSNQKYARYIDQGTPIGTGPSGGPRPYLTPAFEQEITPAKMAKRLRRELRKEVRSMGGAKVGFTR